MSRRVALAILVIALGACGGETPAPAPTTPGATPVPRPTPAPTPASGRACAQDSECVLTNVVLCRGCCDCPRVMTVAEEREIQERSERVDCEAIDCVHTRCEPCATPPARVVCEAGACVGKYDSAAPARPPDLPNITIQS